MYRTHRRLDILENSKDIQFQQSTILYLSFVLVLSKSTLRKNGVYSRLIVTSFSNIKNPISKFLWSVQMTDPLDPNDNFGMQWTTEEDKQLMRYLNVNLKHAQIADQMLRGEI